MRILAALILLVGLLTAGCWDRRDPEKVAWVTAVGVDKAPNGNYLWSFQLPVITGPGGGGGAGGTAGGGKGAGQTDVFAVASPDLATAITASQAFVARRVILVHAKALVIGEGIAREGVGAVIGGATRYQELRRNLSIMVSKGRAYDFLRLTSPRMESNVSRWFETLQQTNLETGLMPLTRIHEFVIEGETPGSGSRATLVASRPDIEAGTEELDVPEQPEGGPPAIPGDVEAGSVRRLKEVPVEFIGMAVFKADKLAGFLSGNETRMVNMLRGDLRQAYIGLTDPIKPTRRVGLRIKGQFKPTRQLVIRGTQVTVYFYVPMEGELVNAPSGVDYTKDQATATLEASIAAQLKNRSEAVLEKTLHQWGADIYFIGQGLRKGFADLPAWEAFNWGRRVKEVRYVVKVDFHVRRFGLQKGPAVQRE